MQKAGNKAIAIGGGEDLIAIDWSTGILESWNIEQITGMVNCL